jgi:Phage integrase, N-terminal SAM-like domain
MASSWIRRFIVFYDRRHPRELRTEDITAFITWLAVEQHVAASTQNQALSLTNAMRTKDQAPKCARCTFFVLLLTLRVSAAASP